MRWGRNACATITIDELEKNELKLLTVLSTFSHYPFPFNSSGLGWSLNTIKRSNFSIISEISFSRKRF